MKANIVTARHWSGLHQIVRATFAAWLALLCVCVTQFSSTAGAQSPVLLRTFINPTPATGDNLGAWMAPLGGDRALIGAPYDDTTATNAGAAYLFSANGTLLHTITNPAPAIADTFSSRLAAVAENAIVLSTFKNHAQTTGDYFSWAIADFGNESVTLSAPFEDTTAARAGAGRHLTACPNLITSLRNRAAASSVTRQGSLWLHP